VRESGVADLQRIGAGKRLTDVIVHGDTVYFSGYVAESAAGGSVTEQTRDILAQIDESLAEAGTTKDRIVEATIWLADIASYDEMNAVWDAWVEPGRAPTRACVEAKLASPGLALEIRIKAV
jgi:enamine deaminase RidA (YjgF/YER057c/UK114 family)